MFLFVAFSWDKNVFILCSFVSLQNQIAQQRTFIIERCKLFSNHTLNVKISRKTINNEIYELQIFFYTETCRSIYRNPTSLLAYEIFNLQLWFENNLCICHRPSPGGGGGTPGKGGDFVQDPIPANFFRDESVRFLSWQFREFWTRHDHFRRFPMKSEVFRRSPKTSKVFRSLRAWLHEPGCFGVGWPGCHVIAKLIFVAFNKHAEIPANSNLPG